MKIKILAVFAALLASVSVSFSQTTNSTSTNTDVVIAPAAPPFDSDLTLQAWANPIQTKGSISGANTIISTVTPYITGPYVVMPMTSADLLLDRAIAVKSWALKVSQGAKAAHDFDVSSNYFFDAAMYSHSLGLDAQSITEAGNLVTEYTNANAPQNAILGAQFELTCYKALAKTPQATNADLVALVAQAKPFAPFTHASVNFLFLGFKPLLGARADAVTYYNSLIDLMVRNDANQWEIISITNELNHYSGQ
jgi:hypothetical protein